MPQESITVEINNVTKLVDRYTNGDKMAQQALTQMMQAVVDITAADAAVYPPTSEANQPPVPYYIRGTGTQYTNGNRGESAQLGNQWEKSVELQDNGVVGVVKNIKAPYAPYVHGMLSQLGIHATRGWRSVAKIADGIRKKANDYGLAAASRYAKYLKTGHF